jgi:hypothetical protein
MHFRNFWIFFGYDGFTVLLSVLNYYLATKRDLFHLLRDLNLGKHIFRRCMLVLVVTLCPALLFLLILP